MARWPIGDVDALIKATLANDSIIKTKMGVTGSDEARVSGYRVVRDPAYFPYIYFYSIPGTVARVNGTQVVQWNPTYDIEVRTLGSPTDDSEDIVDRIDALIGTMVRQVTPSTLWVVSAAVNQVINIPEQGESPEVYYMRRGHSYNLFVTRS